MTTWVGIPRPLLRLVRMNPHPTSILLYFQQITAVFIFDLKPRNRLTVFAAGSTIDLRFGFVATVEHFPELLAILFE